MDHGPSSSGDLPFLQAFYKRGFINLPRMLFDFQADLELDYETIGRIFAVMTCMGGSGENALDDYQITRKSNPRDFDQVRSLVLELHEKEIIRCENATAQEVRFSFSPLFFRMHATWEHYHSQREEEQATGVHPAIRAAEKMLGNLLSDAFQRDIQDWIDSFGFETDMVVAVIKEGQRQGVTHRGYLNQIALRWYEEGIHTAEEAEAFAQQYQKWVGRHKGIIQYIGLKRPLTKAEQQLMERWTGEFGFSNEVIIRACAEATGAQNPLQYVNGVLEAWHGKGIRTVADADRLQEEHKRRGAKEPASRNSNGSTARRTSGRSNVFIRGEEKDDDYYDYIYKKPGQ